MKLRRSLVLAILISSVLLLQSQVHVQHVFALGGIYHNPYGHDDLYSTEPTERAPRDPMAGDSVTINATTWPIESGPYFVDVRGDSVSGSSMTDIKRVYVTNDSANIYVRVDNAAGAFSSYNTEPKFALHVYSEDFAHAATTSKTTGIYNGSLDRSMNYMVGRWSDSTDYGRWVVSGGAWTYNYSLSSVIAPQWDTTTGRVEAVIPIASLSSSTPALGTSWANMDIALAYHNPTSGVWTDDDMLQIHYRLSTSSQAWTYGNIEQ